MSAPTKRKPTAGAFKKGNAQHRAWAAKGGRVSAASRRKIKAPYTGTILDAMDDAGLTGPTWEPWRVVMRATFGLPLTGDALLLYRQHTERQEPPVLGEAVDECWVVAGRRGGKSRMAAVVALFCALRFDATALAAGELAVVPLLAADRRQARIVLAYLKALCQSPAFHPYVHRITGREGIELHTGVNLEVATASFRTIRGFTVAAAVLDEVAFWRDEESASTNPDHEILDALRPGMATVPGSLLFAISSPYARRGELYATYERYYGVQDKFTLVWNSDTQSLNPTIAVRVIERAYEKDALSAAAEYGRDGKVSFRRDVEAFIDSEAIAAATVPERLELAPLDDIQYFGFVDPSGGSRDSFTVAVAHRQGADHAVLDAIRETRPPFSPDSVVEQYAALLHSYRVTEVVGDRYAGEWPRESFRKHGVTYLPSELTKSGLYIEIVAPLNANRIELLDNAVLRSQLLGLERRTARGGRDSVDHAPGGRDDVANSACGALGLALPHSPNGKQKKRVQWV